MHEMHGKHSLDLAAKEKFIFQMAAEKCIATIDLFMRDMACVCDMQYK